MARESFLSIYAPDFVSIEGTIDDDETLDVIMHYVNNVTFKEGDKRQVKVRIGEEVYFVCPGDTRESILQHNERRVFAERRAKRIIPPFSDRRSGDDRRHGQP